MFQNGSDGNEERRNGAKEIGKALLEIIRLLTEMAPEERNVLIELLNALV